MVCQKINTGVTFYLTILKIIGDPNTQFNDQPIIHLPVKFNLHGSHNGTKDLPTMLFILISISYASIRSAPSTQKKNSGTAP